MSKDQAVFVRGLTKTYRSNIIALDNVSLSIERGIIFSLLGKNGAGKTTFIRIVATQLMPTKGEVKVLGYDVVKEPDKVRKHIAVIPQEARPEASLTPYEHVYYFLRLRGIDRREAEDRTIKWLKEMDLWDYRNKPTGILSGGLRRRVLVSMVLASDASLLFLDEPTAGVDPVTTRVIWDYIMESKKEGKTIILTTHYIDEAELLSDKVAIIDKGKIVKEGTPSEIRNTFKHEYVIVVHGLDKMDLENLRECGETLVIRNTYYIYTDNVRCVEDRFPELLKKRAELYIRPVKLEDVFIKLVGGIE